MRAHGRPAVQLRIAWRTRPSRTPFTGKELSQLVEGTGRTVCDDLYLKVFFYIILLLKAHSEVERYSCSGVFKILVGNKCHQDAN